MTRHLRILLSLALVAAAVALMLICWPAHYYGVLAGVAALAAAFIAPVE